MSDIEIPAWPLVIGAAVAYMVYRSLKPRASTSRNADTPSRTVDVANINIRDVRIIGSMFPTLSEGAIRYALSQNGGSVDRVVEIVLSGVTLPEPDLPKVSRGKSLIKEYGLDDKLNNIPISSSTLGWSEDAKQRQAILKQKKQDMILQARKRWLEQGTKGTDPASNSVIDLSNS